MYNPIVNTTKEDVWKKRVFRSTVEWNLLRKKRNSTKTGTKKKKNNTRNSKRLTFSLRYTITAPRRMIVIKTKRMFSSFFSCMHST
jgi:hypothetical protein